MISLNPLFSTVVSTARTVPSSFIHHIVPHFIVTKVVHSFC